MEKNTKKDLVQEANEYLDFIGYDLTEAKALYNDSKDEMVDDEEDEKGKGKKKMKGKKEKEEVEDEEGDEEETEEDEDKDEMEECKKVKK